MNDDHQANSSIREIINYKILVDKLNEKIQRYTQENIHLTKNLSDLTISYNDLNELHSSMVKSFQSELKEMTALKIEAESQANSFEIKLDQTLDHYGKTYLDTLIKKQTEDHAFEITRKDLEIQTLKTRFLEVNEFAASKNEHEKKMAALEEELEKEKQLHKKNMEEMERERIRATEKLKKEMMSKISETQEFARTQNYDRNFTKKASIYASNKLTSELEYQSKHTEKLMSRNTQLEEQMTALKRDNEIRKQTETELAKRSIYCQQVIKKLNKKIRELEDELDSSKRKSCEHDVDINEDSKMSEELVRFLENKLEDCMSKLNEAQTECEVLKADNAELLEKIKEKSEKYRSLGSLLADYMHDIRTLSPSSDHEEVLTLNLHKLSSVSIENLSADDRAALVFALLKQIQPFISPSNLNIPNVSCVNIVSALGRENSLPDIARKKTAFSVGVQTSFVLRASQLPKLDIDAEMVKAPLRPWGNKLTRSNKSLIIKDYKKLH